MKNYFSIYLSIILSSVLLAGCPSSTSTNSNPGTSSGKVTLSGTVATGAPVTNATITIKGANGSTATATTDSLGQYTSPDISSLTAPYLLRVTTATVDLYSVGNAAGTVNIHPLTDQIIKAWYDAKGTTVAAAFANPTATGNTPPSTTEVTVIKQVLKNLISNWLVLEGIDPQSFDLITTPFNADQTQFDSFLDKIKVASNVISLNTTGASTTPPEYQITLTGASGSYTGLVKEDLDNNTVFATVSTVIVPVAGTTASPYMGTWSFTNAVTAAGTCPGVGGPRTVEVDSNGNFEVMDFKFPTVIGASSNIAADGSVTGNILGNGTTTGLNCAPTGTFTTGTMTDVNTGAGNYTQTDGTSGSFTLTRITTTSPYAGNWVIQGRLNSITGTSLCGSVAAEIGTIIGTDAIVVNADGSFVVMDKQNPGYLGLRGMINADTSFTLTAYGDSLRSSGTCPVSSGSSGTMNSSANYGTGTLNQGGEVLAITLTRGTTATVGAIVGSWSTTVGYKGVITFLANGEYVDVNVEYGSPVAGVQNGMERGIYSWNSLTGAFATGGCPAVDTNGVSGFSHPQGAGSPCAADSGTFTVSGNTLTIVNTDGTFTYTRVAADTARPIVGSWFGGDATGRVTFAFLANGEYVFTQDGPPIGSGTSGIERGTYTWNASTGAFATGGCPAVNTDGDWGFSHDIPTTCGASSGTITVIGNTLSLYGTHSFARVVP